MHLQKLFQPIVNHYEIAFRNNFTQLCMVLATDIYLLKRDFDFVLLMEGKVELK